MEAVFLVLAGGAVSWFGQWLSREWSKADKASERDEARREHHEEQLRVAIAEFCAAASLFLDKGDLLAGIQSAAYESEDEALAVARAEGLSDEDAEQFARAATSELRPRLRQAHEEFFSGSTSADAKAVAILLLIDDAEICKAVRFIGIRAFSLPSPRDKMPAFVADIKARRLSLYEFTGKLTGRFKPQPRSQNTLATELPELTGRD